MGGLVTFGVFLGVLWLCWFLLAKHAFDKDAVLKNAKAAGYQTELADRLVNTLYWKGRKSDDAEKIQAFSRYLPREKLLDPHATTEINALALMNAWDQGKREAELEIGSIDVQDLAQQCDGKKAYEVLAKIKKFVQLRSIRRFGKWPEDWAQPLP